MPQRAPDVMPAIVQRDLTEEQLQHYLGARALAVDTETMGLQHLRDRLCVVQLCDENGRATLVQTPRDQVVSSSAPETRAPRLKRVLEEPRVLKVFHFARFDLAALRHNLGILAAPIYCTRTASKLIRTYTDRHGLKDIALELLDIELDKAARHTDWSSPDLRPEQVRYAISDVTLLVALMEKLNDALAREGRRELAEECFKAIPLLSALDLAGYELLFEH
ncbi:MAG TPA: ribonuclease H-like domain-containing protein [Vicinamibacteria bacterium]|nr:ribonuclease H-like domain-containing protein [Vicinamibacteria bacterium]